MKILIADDSAFMRAILKDIVSKSNWSSAEILEAGDGEEAMSLYNAQKPDLVLLDIIMPKKEGLSVLREIGQAAPAVIIVSSVGQEEVITEARTLGAKDYIVKPFDAKKVIAVLNTLAPHTN